ncbi:MAG: helix-turn-helix domain-containing protein [Deltaproteobacteria bacterium]|nr:helix-turn-helix domain-containing protein [Deltaproteobacteria bacterium]
MSKPKRKTKPKRKKRQGALDAEIGSIKLYTLKTLAEKLGTTERTLREYIKKGRLKATLVGGAWRVSQKNLEEFFKEQSE